MHITWHGLTCIKIQTAAGSVLINPYADSVGLTMPKLKVDIVAITDQKNEQANNWGRLSGEPFLITNPGEYEKNDVMIYGVKVNGQTLFVLEAENIVLGHLGLWDNVLTDAHLEFFEGVDVLFLPISTMNAKTRAVIISQIEPRVIIPLQYKIPKVKIKQEPLDAFAKEMGIKNITGEEKIILKAKNLPIEETLTMVLKPV